MAAKASLLPPSRTTDLRTLEFSRRAFQITVPGSTADQLIGIHQKWLLGVYPSIDLLVDDVGLNLFGVQLPAPGGLNDKPTLVPEERFSLMLASLVKKIAQQYPETTLLNAESTAEVPTIIDIVGMTDGKCESILQWWESVTGCVVVSRRKVAFSYGEPHSWGLVPEVAPGFHLELGAVVPKPWAGDLAITAARDGACVFLQEDDRLTIYTHSQPE